MDEFDYDPLIEYSHYIRSNYNILQPSTTKAYHYGNENATYFVIIVLLLCQM